MQAAALAGEYLLDRFRKPAGLEVERKGFHDYVTEVDRQAEKMIVEYLSSRFPETGMMAEEGAPAEETGGSRWVIDPLDGTTNFIHGVPFFSVSIAFEDSSGLLAGTVYDPVHDEMFHASRGAGAKLNGAAIRCSDPAGMDEALLATGFPFRYFERLEGYLEAFQTFMKSTSGIRRAGSAALDIVYTACGRFDGFFETGLSRWDMAAGAVVAMEAGCRVTDFEGGTAYLDLGEIVVSTERLHREMLAIIRRSMP